ncbi:MAG TPA: protein kinase, partial [Planctomycetota bacterium]|nr:protein kinase [Planctomycetota bacterium]
MAERPSNADDSAPQPLRRSPAQGVPPAKPKLGVSRGPLPPVPKIDMPERPSGILPSVNDNPRRSPAQGVVPAKARPAGASRSNLKPVIDPNAPAPAGRASDAVPVKSKNAGGASSKNNIKVVVDDPTTPVESVPVRAKPGASRSHLKAIGNEDERDGTTRPTRKKVKRGGVGGNEPSDDPETDKLIKNIWRQAVNENTMPGQTIKSLKTAFARAAPSEASGTGATQKFAETFPQSALAGYTLGDEIGRGGMGVVYKAYQQSLKRDVAIKLLLPEMASDPEHAAKFMAEADINAELSHPNIMPVYEIGQTSDGRKYMVMKLVIGISWWSILHPFTEPEKDVARKMELADHLDLLLRTCDAVAYAHSRQIIHRDIKPDNLLVGQYGEVLLMDWGVAADLRPNLPLSEYKAEPLHAINHPAGTPHYMAPEMARVSIAHIGKGTDIYLLGATLYEILTGRPPHQAKETMEILIEAAKNTVLDRDEPTVNRELMRIAKRAMSTMPEDRYASVEQFAQAVREFRKHAESLMITDSAYSSLTIARNSRGARAYQYYSEALGGFTQALQLWPENRDAIGGRFDAISQHTKLSLSSGDLALAESLINQWRSYARHLPAEQKKREDQDIVELSFQ